MRVQFGGIFEVRDPQSLGLNEPFNFLDSKEVKKETYRFEEYFDVYINIQRFTIPDKYDEQIKKALQAKYQQIKHENIYHRYYGPKHRYLGYRYLGPTDKWHGKLKQWVDKHLGEYLNVAPWWPQR